MVERIKIAKCKICGGKAAMYYEREEPGLYKHYFISCNQCPNESAKLRNLDLAVEDWNKKNCQQKVKVKYNCGNCGAEVHLGFSTCPKCGAEIDWKE